jgi:hypothetical protein
MRVGSSQPKLQYIGAGNGSDEGAQMTDFQSDTSPDLP